MRNLINKEQRQYLNPFIKQLALSLDMRQYRLANLNPAELFFAYLAYYVAGINLNAIRKFNRAVPPVNTLYNKSVSVL